MFPRSVRSSLIAILLVLPARAESFGDLIPTFGLTRTLIGIHQASTSNPDGSSINFWNPNMEGQPADSVALSNPHMAGADAYGNIYIADKAGQAILKLSADGFVHTFAGTHVAGFNGDGPAPATDLQIKDPNGLYVLPSGVVYLLDPGNHRIRRVALDGEMTTIVNDPEPLWKSSGRALWVSQDENFIYYTHEFQPVPPNTIADGAVVKRWTPSGGIEIVCDKSVGFRNPGNLDVNPADGKLYVTDRGEDDITKMSQGLFRIDGINQRTRVTGDVTQPVAADGQLAINSYIQETRGIAFRPDGSYFICGHKDGNIWFVDTQGVLHLYLRGSGRKDAYLLPDATHPPLLDQQFFAQPRSVTLAPNGNLLVVCNDSGFLFQVASIVPSFATNLLLNLQASGAQLQWTGLPGHGYRIESATTLQPDAWDSVTAIGANSGAYRFVDPGALSSPTRFYRILPSL
jgi:DNA-binding beta-propeller fold protein YncE